MMNSALPDTDLEELARRSDALIEQLKPRMGTLGEMLRLREICDGGALRLEADVFGPDARKEKLSVAEMTRIVDRATFLLSSFYVHLATKRALHANDPLQALRNLKAELGREQPRIRTEEQFHDRLTAIVAGLHDRHTNYYLPAPYRHTVVFLPFLVEAAKDPVDGRSRYLVTKPADPSVAALFQMTEGVELPVEVTHVNGVPIKQVVARNGEESAGSNDDAREARGVDRLTFRWLGLGTGPREDWVDVRFKIGEQTAEKRFEWLAVLQPMQLSDTGPRAAGSGRAVGHDLEGEWIRKVKETLFSRTLDGDVTSIEGGIAVYRTLPPASAAPAYGYLRIFTFEVAPARVDAFISRIRNILRGAPKDGLIIDIRGNPGGNVFAAEGLLQLFSAGPVARQGIQFVNTPDAINLASMFFHEMRVVAPAFDAQSTAAPFVVFPEMPRQKDVVRPEQVYQGPVVVIVDPNCYSASEMFAAGMQDHGLARIIGTHRQTGGGGGVVWSDELIAKVCANAKKLDLRNELAEAVQQLRKQLLPLPGGASFEVAVLRTTRAGEHAGVAVEDMGVVVRKEDVVELTDNDVLRNNADVRAAAIRRLESMSPKPQVHATYARGTFTLTTQKLDRVDVYVDGRPVDSLDQLGTQRTLPTPVKPPRGRVVFRGFRHDEVVATYRHGRQPAPATKPKPDAAQPDAAQPAPAQPAPAQPEDREA